jgi:predicted DNA-binding transcriptional regulator AlpA
MPDARWLDRDALAAHICESPTAIYRLVKQGRIPEPSYKLGRRKPRWDRDAVDAALAGAVASRPKGAAHLAAAILEESRR